jgi:hypothetical protein
VKNKKKISLKKEIRKRPQSPIQILISEEKKRKEKKRKEKKRCQPSMMIIRIYTHQ